MTTNVYDRLIAVMASDSRWSIDAQNLIWYVDDTGYDKIFYNDDLALMFAGSSILIDQWKNWFKQQAEDLHQLNSIPELTRNNQSIAICIALRTSNQVLFEYGASIKTEHLIVAGSGANYANNCWQSNQYPIRAIQSAKNQDIYSGGIEKYYYLLNSENNICDDVSLDVINQCLFERGFVMYKSSDSTAIPMKEPAKNDEKVQDLIQQLNSGGLSANAPYEKMGQAWPAKKVAELKKVLKNHFNNKK